MKHTYILYALAALAISGTVFWACDSDDSGNGDPNAGGPDMNDFTEMLTNQVNEVIIPSMNDYRDKMGDLVTAVADFESTTDANNLDGLRDAFQAAYLAYQAAAVHNYFATTNQALVKTTNLYPVDVALLGNLIENESYNFNTTAQETANGFPAIDYMLHGPEDVVSYFINDAKNMAFLKALVSSMEDRASLLASQWGGELKANFVTFGGTALGSSISAQLNGSVLYYEEHIRGGKVGFPIGRLGPNDTPIDPDPTKIEAYHQSLFAGNEDFPLALVRAAVEEMEDLYLGTTSTDTDGQGYDDLLVAREQSAIDADIKAQFKDVYSQIDSRDGVNGNAALYESVQKLVTLYKSDLFPVLNVQDADGANDGD